MKITILTLFPEMFRGPFEHSIIKRAKEKGLIKINLVNIRDFALSKHKTVDDRPYGGGVGMIMRVDVINKAIEKSKITPVPEQSSVRGALNRPPVWFMGKNQKSKIRERVILLDPSGKLFNQKLAQKLSSLDHLILVCGHYEGVDERVRKLVNEEISIGDYILTGGEIPAMVVVDSLTRLIPGVLKKKEATKEESLASTPGVEARTLEYPQYTRPPSYRGLKVPKILLSGNHRAIKKWQKEQASLRTKRKRPDLLKGKGI